MKDVHIGYDGESIDIRINGVYYRSLFEDPQEFAENLRRIFESLEYKVKVEEVY